MYIEKNIFEDQLIYDNTVILKYHIEYPKIIHTNNRNSVIFNLYNEHIAISLKTHAENQLFQDAINLYEFNKKNNYPTMVYEIYQTYQITFNEQNIISLYIDEYIFTGGAHGSTTRSSQTWDLNIGKQLELCYFFTDPYFLLAIFQNIKDQIQKDPAIYFDDACCLLIDSFNPQSFYITPSGIIIYFQQYDIAPYSSGIRTFLINLGGKI